MRLKLHLPLLPAGVVIFVLPFVGLDALTSYLVGAWQYYVNVEVPQYPPILVFFIVCYYGSVYARRRIENLQAYCQTLGVDAEAQLNLRPLTGLKGVGLIWAVQFFTLVPLFTFASSVKLSLVQLILVNSVAWAYAFFMIGTFVWVYGYSMYSIYRMGKLPLKLKPFTADKTLGLKPFGAASLRLTAIFFLWILLTALESIIVTNFGLTSTANAAFDVGFPLVTGLFGLALFFLPLISMRRKLVQKKKEELSWLEPRRTRIIDQIRGTKDESFDMHLLNEYNSIMQVEKEVHQVHNWPFDVGIVARLAAIILSVTAILLSHLITVALRF